MSKSIDARSQQYCFLKASLGTNNKDSSRSLPPALFLWGLRNTGKTFTLDKFLVESGIRYQIYIDSLEVICGSKVLLQSILRQLIDQTGRQDIVLDKEVDKCDDPDSFISHLQSLGREQLNQDPVILVLDHADSLRGGNEDILHLLIRLREYTTHNFCTLILSHLPWKNFTHTECPNPLQIHFPQYTQSQIQAIIISRPPKQGHLEAFQVYVEMVLKLYFTSYRDLSTLRRIVQLKQVQFLEGYNPDDLITQDELQRRSTKFLLSCKKGEIQKSLSVEKEGNLKNIPAAFMFLIIAAFIASANPPKTDRHIFVKGKSGGKTKRARIDTEIIRSTKVGIPQGRIVAIFTHLSQHNFPLDTSLMSNFEDLCAMNFLCRVGSEGDQDEPKYRVDISENFAQQLSDIVGIKLDEILVSRQ